MGIEAQYYDNHAGNALDQVNNPQEIERARKTVEKLPLPIQSVLDVGCGCGLALNAIQTARPNLKLVGLERSQKTAQEARSIFGLNVVDGSADNLPFEDDAFDVVMANELLEHLPWGVYQETLKELVRVARHSIIVTTPYDEKRQFVTCPQCECKFSPFYHVRTFNEEKLKHLFEGFTKVDQELIWVPGRVPLVYEARRLKAALGYVPPLPGKTICPQCGFRNKSSVDHGSSADTAAGPVPSKSVAGRMLIGFLGRLPRSKRAKWAVVRYENVALNDD